MRKNCLLLVFGLFGLSMPFLAKAPAITKEQALAKLDAFNGSFKGMHASLDLTTVTALVDDKQTSTGEIFYDKKGKASRIRIDIKTPAPRVTLLNGDTATFYDIKLAQAQQFSVASDKNHAETSLLQLPGLGSSANVSATYDVTLVGEESVGGKTTAVLDLKPKTSHIYSMIRLWVDEQKGNPVQIQFTEPSKDYTVYRFSNIEFGTQPDSKFDVHAIVPKNVMIQRVGD